MKGYMENKNFRYIKISKFQDWRISTYDVRNNSNIWIWKELVETYLSLFPFLEKKPHSYFLIGKSEITSSDNPLLSLPTSSTNDALSFNSKRNGLSNLEIYRPKL